MKRRAVKTVSFGNSFSSDDFIRRKINEELMSAKKEKSLHDTESKYDDQNM